MAERSGFFNALKTSTGYDIKYNSDDYSACLAAIISNGVRRSSANDLRVNASGGMSLTINVGFAMINGRWYWNDAIFTSFSVPTAPAGDLARKDRVVLRLDTSISSRNIRLAYIQGSTSVTPTAPELTRNNSIYEISIATINVNPNARAISQDDITDDRDDPDLCGWITTPIGYQDFFANLDTEFNEWFVEKKNTLASVTLFQKYMQRLTTFSITKIVEFNIPQYDPTGVDIIEVYVNGILKIKDIDYVVTSKTVITFTDELISGTNVDIYVYKSIDGTGLGSVADAVAELQKQMSTIKNIGEYIYICNGVNDNVKLSELANSLTSTNSNDSVTINIYGNFGVSVPVSGLGTTSSRFRWFDFSSSKKITFDFLNSTEIRIVNSNPTQHYIGFYGSRVHLKNMRIYVSGTSGNRPASFEMFPSGTGSLFCENCRFFIYGEGNTYISSHGTFNDCYGEVISATGKGYCFWLTQSANLVRLNGGEYRAYRSSGNTNDSYVIYNGIDLAAVVTFAVSFSTVFSTYGSQNGAIYNDGYGTFVGSITTLPITKGQFARVHEVIGTIPESKSGVNG